MATDPATTLAEIALTIRTNAPTVPADSRPRTRGPHTLRVAETAFDLLITGPSPLALDGVKVGHGLPARMVDLGELRRLLLSAGAGDAMKDAAWTELVQRARTGEAAWVIGCVGVALPGLRNLAARVTATVPSSISDDIVSELVTEFLAQLQRVDLNRPHIAERLVLWARKAALRGRGPRTAPPPARSCGRRLVPARSAHRPRQS